MGDKTSDDGAEKLPVTDTIIKNRRNGYKVIELLGRGGFGAVFKVEKVSNGKILAMKCEILGGKKMEVLMMDCKVLKGASNIKSPHFCSVLDRGVMESRFNYLIMTMVGRNLWDLRMERDETKFTLSTALKVAEQCLMSIEDLHTVGFLHRDIKPGNFCMGRVDTKESHTVFMLDFGLCRKFVGQTQEQDLRRPRDTAPFRGTTRYASISALAMKEQSRKDDLEAWMYMVVEWTAGELPWRKLSGKDKADVLLWKEVIRDEEDSLLDFLAACPSRQFSRILKYLYSLTYISIPDYTFIYLCLANAMKAMKIDPKQPLDWDLEHEYRGPTVADREGGAMDEIEALSPHMISVFSSVSGSPANNVRIRKEMYQDANWVSPVGNEEVARSGLWQRVRKWFGGQAVVDSKQYKEMCLPVDNDLKIVWDLQQQRYVGEGVEDDVKAPPPPTVPALSVPSHSSKGIPARRYQNAFAQSF